MDLEVRGGSTRPDRDVRGEDAAVTGTDTDCVDRAASGCNADGLRPSKARTGPSFLVGESLSDLSGSSSVSVEDALGEVLSLPRDSFPEKCSGVL